MATSLQGNAPFPWRLWFAVFILTMIAAFLIQLVLLPSVFPSWNAGEGMLDNCLDCAQYHRIAVTMAAEIRRDGWSAWELRPEGHAPAGLAAALYTATFPRLWTMIPINAAVHATTVALLFLILTSFGCPSRRAVLGAAPFALFPSSALWYAQLLKDGFFFLGFFLFVRGWISIMQNGRPGLARAQVLSVGQALSGGLILWIVRPDMARLILSLSFVVCAIALGSTLVSVPLRLTRRAFLKGCALALAATASVICLDYIPARTAAPESVSALPPTVPHIDRSDREKRPVEGRTQGKLGRSAVALRRLASLPARLAEVAIRKRQGYVAAHGASEMDRDFRPATFFDLVAYLPRATRNAFLSPFPSDWVGQGTHSSTTVLRRVCGLEMLVVYFALGFVPFAVWRRREDLFLWAALLHAGGVLIVVGVIVNNWGTLYRLRYGYLMLWVGIGLVGFQELAAEFHQRRRLRKQHPA